MATIKVKIQTKEQLELLQVKDLKVLCKKYEFENYSGLKKEEIIKSLLSFYKNIENYDGFEIETEKMQKVVFHRKPKSIGIKSFNNFK
jgi:hypothetical protein